MSLPRIELTRLKGFATQALWLFHSLIHFRLGLCIMVAFSITNTAVAQLTPGPLHRSHEALEGLRNCTKCHQIGSKDFQSNCLSCHQILQSRIEAGLGLHAREGYDQCQLCHTEHHGRDFDLIHWKDGIENFDHRLTGFELSGAHLDPKCRDCHRATNLVDSEKLLAAGKDPQRTFLGLDSGCLACHQDTHRGEMSRDCLSCHDMNAWTPAPKFDHDKAAFQLAGAHRPLTCTSCHQPAIQDAGTTLRVFKPLAHDGCLACHEDTHQGTLSNDCLTCHNQETWKPASLFNHAGTAFPLTGQHRDAACEQCHVPRPIRTTATFTTRIFEGLRFGTCGDCHKDPHQGRLGNDCAQCHDTAQWRKVDTKAFRHDQTRFPLLGKHNALNCESCHRPGQPLAIAQFGACSDCHSDFHQGQFARSETMGQCEACHSVDGFKPSSFNIQRHAKTNFSLQGAHLAIPCIACHSEVGSPAFDPPTTQFNLSSKSCNDCHENPHGGNLMARLGANSCRSCHDVTGWQAVDFDHAKTEFPILGQHLPLDCKSCHRNQKTNGFFLEPMATRCAACHEDVHRGQFADQSGQTNCENCHPNASWQPKRFDHNRDAAFKLEGAHEKAACGSCHPKELLGQLSVMRFKPLSRNCEDCHTQNKRGGRL